jgi:hypothetical protein
MEKFSKTFEAVLSRSRIRVFNAISNDRLEHFTQWENVTVFLARNERRTLCFSPGGRQTMGDDSESGCHSLERTFLKRI